MENDLISRSALLDALEQCSYGRYDIKDVESCVRIAPAVDAAEIAALKSENERIRQATVSMEVYQQVVAERDAAVAAFPPEEIKAQQWISVKDRLPVRPEDTFHDGHWWMVGGEAFIVSDSDGKVFEAYWTYGCGCQNYFWYENSLIPLTNITHWMPLPEPPKEEIQNVKTEV